MCPSSHGLSKHYKARVSPREDKAVLVGTRVWALAGGCRSHWQSQHSTGSHGTVPPTPGVGGFPVTGEEVGLGAQGPLSLDSGIMCTQGPGRVAAGRRTRPNPLGQTPLQGSPLSPLSSAESGRCSYQLGGGLGPGWLHQGDGPASLGLTAQLDRLYQTQEQVLVRAEAWPPQSPHLRPSRGGRGSALSLQLAFVSWPSAPRSCAKEQEGERCRFPTPTAACRKEGPG